MMTGMEVIGIEYPEEIKMGDDLVSIFLASFDVEDGDVVIFSSKVVSKSEGRVVTLSDVRVSEEAKKLADETGKNPEIVQLILDESDEIVKAGNGFIITETRGYICANAGIDESNVEEGKAVLLPKSPQRSARMLREEIEKRTGNSVAVLISDSVGRPFREGVVGTCIGFSGISPVRDRRGERDRFGKISRITKVGIADELCSAANLVMGEFREGIPIAVVRGFSYERGEFDFRELVFDREKDIFR
ncbi:MAG: coenzyme F420-0:L-glutamate ligase [Candidatus Syntropharchaeia archaeon]